MGLASKYHDPVGVHIKNSEMSDSFQGNFSFASCDAMNFFKTSRKDDIISLFLMTISLLNNNEMVGKDEEVKRLIEISENDDTSY